LREMDKTIKVCNVAEEGRFGGPQRRITQVAVALQNHNVDTHVVYPVMDSEVFAQNLKQGGVKCTSLNITRLTKERKVLIRYALRFLWEIWVLSSFFKKNHFDIIHANGSYQFKVAIAAKLSGIPLVWHLNDTMMSSLVYRAFKATQGFCAKGFIVAGQRVFDYYLDNSEIKGRPFSEINAPVDTEKFSPSGNEVNLDSEKLTVVSLSGINPTKGVEYFVRMAACIHKVYPQVRFKVAGAELRSHQIYSNMVKELVTELRVEDYIEFHGLVDDVVKFLDSADICVFTSISEASPTAIWEAMSMGKAVVTTDVGSVNKYIGNGVSGDIVPVKDVDALCDRTLKLIDNQELRDGYGQVAREVAEKELDVKAVAKKHKEIYERIIKHAAGEQS